MYEKYMIVPEKAKKTEAGFEIGARLPYYRGVSLSMLEEIEVSVDGETLPQEDVLITVNGKKWFYGSPGTKRNKMALRINRQYAV